MNKIDLSFLKNLMQGDEGMTNRFLDIFKQQVPHQVACLKEDIKKEDWENLSNTLHSLKSQFGYLNLPELARQMKTMEDIADDNKDIESIRGLMDTFEAEVKILFEEEFGVSI